VVAMPEHRGLRRHEQIGKVTEALKDIAKELDVPLIALCQLNRDAENQRPQLSNLKESGDIEQDADIVVFLYHPETEANAKLGDYDAHDAELIVEKHRHGARGAVSVFWTPWETRFSGSKEFQP
jgi:replicative DNA helicase